MEARGADAAAAHGSKTRRQCSANDKARREADVKAWREAYERRQQEAAAAPQEVEPEESPQRQSMMERSTGMFTPPDQQAQARRASNSSRRSSGQDPDEKLIAEISGMQARAAAAQEKARTEEAARLQAEEETRQAAEGAWIVQFSAEYGRAFFGHRLTGATTWEAPSEQLRAAADKLEAEHRAQQEQGAEARASRERA